MYALFLYNDDCFIKRIFAGRKLQILKLNSIEPCSFNFVKQESHDSINIHNNGIVDFGS